MQKLKKSPLDILIISIWTVLTVVFVLIPAFSSAFITTLMSILMMLLIPGYALLAALFPRKDDLEAVERIALSIGLSIATASLFGLLLNLISEVKLVPLLLTLCVHTMALAFIAVQRREKLPEEEQFSVPFHRIYDMIDNELGSQKSRTDRISTVVLIFLIALAISAVYFVITVPKIGERFTEFYILGPEGKAGNYTTDLKYNAPATILVGVVNHEYTSVNYTVQIVLDREVLTDAWFMLDHDETWEKNITFVPDKEGRDMKLELLLYKEDNFTVPYQVLNLWVSVRK